MTLNVALTHQTRYRYRPPVSIGPQIVRLRPAPHCRTPILAYSLRIAPVPHFLNWQQDPFGNFLARVLVPGETKELTVTVDLISDMAAINPFDFFVEESAVSYPFTYDLALADELEPYLRPLPGEVLCDDYLCGIDRSGKTTIDFVTDLNRKLSRDIGYRVRLEPGVQTPTETLANRSGSCRDSGWLLVQLLRPLGPLARVAVASGAFAGVLGRGVGQSLDELARFSSEQVFELARFVEQVSPEALRRVASAVSAHPPGASALTVAAALLLMRLMQEREAAASEDRAAAP